MLSDLKLAAKVLWASIFKPKKAVTVVVNMNNLRIVNYINEHTLVWEVQARGDICFWKWNTVKQWTDV